MLLNGATVEDLSVAELKWMLDDSDKTLWEFIEACPHWKVEFHIQETNFGKILSSANLCPDCGQRLAGISFGEFVEMRTKQCRIEKWKHCVLLGIPQSVRLNCDCKFHPRRLGGY